MNKRLIFTASTLLFIFVSAQSGAAQAAPTGDWTGGFFTGGNWAIVNIRFNREKETLRGNADVVFPSYSNSVSARNAELKSVKSDAVKIEFEIPFNTEKIVFRGRISGKTISGEYEYAAASGDF